MAYTLANYSTFNPREEVLPYILLYNQSYKDTLDKIEKQEEDLALMELPEESKYKSVIDKYKSDLSKWSDSFAGGMTALNQAELRSLFKRSKKELAPIKQAIADYNKYVDKVDALGSDAIHTRKLSIDDFYGGTKPGMDYQSEKSLVQGSSEYFKGFGNLLSSENPEFEKLKLAAGYLLLKNPGMDPGEALAAVASEPGTKTGSIILKAMYDYALSAGIDKYDKEGQKRIWSAIGKGIIKSYDNNNKVIQDRSFKDELTTENIESIKEAREARQVKDRDWPHPDYMPEDIIPINGKYIYRGSEDFRTGLYPRLKKDEKGNLLTRKASDGVTDVPVIEWVPIVPTSNTAVESPVNL